ncbi:MAG: hypothetical protein ACPG4T_17450, partial [Nannocystaceae bacterium]
RAVGSNLHLAVVVAKPPNNGSLTAGDLYSYDIEVETEDGTTTLDGFELLSDAAGGPGVHAHLALGYAPGRLPSFRIPPASYEDLVLFQGSCRKPYGPRFDVLQTLDAYTREDSGKGPRPHLLVMSGDQIYADSVAPEMLPLLTEAGSSLMGGQETVDIELEVPNANNLEVVQVPVTQWFLPAGRRQRVTAKGARMTASGQSHLLGLGEFCAMYLMVWSNTLWPTDFFDTPLTSRGNDVATYQGRLQQLYAALEAGDLTKAQASVAEDKIPYRDGAVLLPDKGRWIDRYLTSEDTSIEWGDEDVGSLAGELEAPDVTVPGGLQGPPAEHLAVVGSDEKMHALARMLTPSWYAGKRHFGFSVVKDGTLLDDHVIIHLQRLRSFFDGLPRVRRAMANVSTLMLFDDHEVTDDWNISQEWVEGVNQSTLGKTMLRNGMLAYATFQAWGNDPERYADPTTPEHKLLDELEELLLSQGQPRPLGSAPDPTTAASINAALDIGGGNTPVDARVRWHFEVPVGNTQVIGLDTRTHRGFIAPTAPPALMIPEQITAQIPAPGPNAADIPILVISPAPVLGFPTIENYLQPFYNFKHRYAQPGELFALASGDYFTGIYQKDPEPWGFSDEALENLYARLAPHRKIVFLSGDVHYSCAIKLDYWAFDHVNNVVTPSRFVQLTGSALRNRPEEFKVMLTHTGFGQQLTALVGTPRERLAWHRGDPQQPDPIAPPPGEEFSQLVQRRLTQNPVLVPAKALPQGTIAHAPPDWGWRYDMVEDKRPDSERMPNLGPPPLAPY